MITADAGYHSSSKGTWSCRTKTTPALIADSGGGETRRAVPGIRPSTRPRPTRLQQRRTQRSKYPKLFKARQAPVQAKRRTTGASARRARRFTAAAARLQIKGIALHRFKGAIRDCEPCKLRDQCLRTPDKTRIRQVAINLHRAKPVTVVEPMRQAIDSPRGRGLHSQRIGTVEPVFGNLRHNKRLTRFTVRGPMQGEDAVDALLPSAQHRKAWAMLSGIGKASDRGSSGLSNANDIAIKQTDHVIATI